MSYESADLLPKTDSAYLDYTRFRETFGQEGNVMVFAIQDSGFYQLNKTNDWIQMGNDIKALQGVNALMSITHTFNLQKNTDLKKFEVLPIFPSHIETQAELDSLAYVAEHLPFYDGMLINRDKHTYNMMITVSAEVMNSPARVKLVQDVLEITKRFTEKYHLKMHYSGMPYIRVINAENIKGEMYMFIALSLLITAIILYLFFRSFRIVGFCVGIIGINVIWAIGYMVDDLKETDPIRQDLSFFESNFDGLMPLEVTLDFGKPNQVFKLSNLEKLDRLNTELSQDPDLSRALSVVEAAKFANQAYYNGKASYYKLPSNMTKNFIMKYVMESTGGMNAMANSFVDSTMQKVRMNFRVKDIGTKKMEAKEDSLYKKIETIFPRDKHDISVTGSSVIFFKGNQYLIKNLFSSLALAIVLIAGFMAWMFKSKRMVLIALVPNVIPQIITAAVMGYFGIPIKASTILVFSVAFGISVDNTIHYLAKYRQELQATNWSIRSSVVLALKETGQSMIYTSIILLFGFGIFCLSSFGGTFALGLLTSITLFAAMLANLILLPSLLLTMEHSISKRTFRAEPLLQIYNEEEDIDEDKLDRKSVV